jgi:hypothetical protein
MCVSCERYDLPVFQCMFPYNQVVRYWDDDDEYASLVAFSNTMTGTPNVDTMRNILVSARIKVA